jgi:ribA/ribD-fused uncharacterized protein
MEAFTFFFTAASPFSQWFPCSFTDQEHEFCCMEQYMMHGKALLFGDAAIASEVMAAVAPKTHKALGRKVTPFDDKVWRAHREEIVMRGNRVKFTQNVELRTLLLATAGTTLVEASPFDRIWGIGLGATNPLAQQRSTWRGQNLLGHILTELREELMT